jgi:hypothetical protein
MIHLGEVNCAFNFYQMLVDKSNFQASAFSCTQSDFEKPMGISLK